MDTKAQKRAISPSAQASEPTPMPIEQHPFAPFMPPNARLLMLGSFPPSQRRWTMDFYYPNYINDMWRIMGLVFFSDKSRFVSEATHSFLLPDIKRFLADKGIALFDTATRVRRLKGSASDKFLEIVEQTDIAALCAQLPQLKAVCVTGQKAAEVAAQQLGVEQPPKMGQQVEFSLTVGAKRKLHLYREPSSSRAYPMALERKAAFYADMMRHIGLI